LDWPFQREFLLRYSVCAYKPRRAIHEELIVVVRLEPYVNSEYLSGFVIGHLAEAQVQFGILGFASSLTA
jgi:hypothetical protein